MTDPDRPGGRNCYCSPKAAALPGLRPQTIYTCDKTAPEKHLRGRGSSCAGDHSLFRWILPLMVLGSSSRNTTMRGYLYGAVRFFT